MTPVNDDEIPLPEGDLLTRTVVKPTDISLRGDVDAGWLLNQMDAAGANLARRTIGEIMLPMLFNRFPKMKLIAPEKIAWSGFRFRGPISLPVTTA